MLNVVIYDKGRKFRIFQVDEETQKRRDVTASYRLVDMVAINPEGRRVVGFFFGEEVGHHTEVDEKEAAKRLRT